MIKNPTSHTFIKSTIFVILALLLGFAPPSLAKASAEGSVSSVVQDESDAPATPPGSDNPPSSQTPDHPTSTPTPEDPPLDHDPDEDKDKDEDEDEDDTPPTTTPTTPTPETPPDPDDESYEFASDLIIKSVNPGFDDGDDSDVGEIIELLNLSDYSVSLAGYTLYYCNSSGTWGKAPFFTLPDGLLAAGETLSLSFKKAPYAKQADLIYPSTLARTAQLELRLDGQKVDSINFNGKSDNYKFDKDHPSTLVRNLLTGEFDHDYTYKPTFNPTHSHLALAVDPDDEDPENPEEEKTPEEAVALPPRCYNLEFSELFTYYVTSPSEQFIEFYNPDKSPVDLTGCSISYKKKTYPLSGTIEPEGYLAFYPSKSADTPFTLTKNPTSSNELSLLDTTGDLVETLVYEHGQKSGMSFAKFYSDLGLPYWEKTYSPTPGATNTYQEFQTCPAGKVINPLTGNCVKTTSTASGLLEPCPAGKYRNPLTGRCKNLETATASTLTECKEGYERNPETNRCRKIKTDNDGATYALVPATSSDGTSFAALGVVITLVGIGTLYIILQFRHEIARAARKARQRLHDIFVNHLARFIRRDRD